ncbi:hypothetical protein [Ideonella sp.]|uniref:hypothetical protein n=1 Tax=Ideonella sp. TaxID=1929293 RepID=UPI0035B00644
MKLAATELRALIAFLACWLLAGLLCYYNGLCMQGWFELFNGATWPEKPEQVAGDKWWLFSIILGFRTALNLSVAITALMAVVWFYSGGKRKLVELSVERQIKHRENAMLGQVAVFLHENFPAEQITADLISRLQSSITEFMSNNWEIPRK